MAMNRGNGRIHLIEVVRERPSKRPASYHHEYKHEDSVGTIAKPDVTSKAAREDRSENLEAEQQAKYDKQ
ncbi:hypothetical protein GCM10011383_01620 [Hymenobacter cavernae]|uniref:Uncharacterized protein n=1 Tax=Hymenobacter cavernae TaxID=2044852 RepID=A0ABQ1TJ03_9BACT|nr:hypothetical protein GCM10011383_01620 [Hymenobacter cavernae]